MEAKRVVRVVEREWVVWRRLWRGSVFSYVFAPLLFLAEALRPRVEMLQRNSPFGACEMLQRGPVEACA